MIYIPPMMRLRSHLQGQWVDGEAVAVLVDPATEEPVAEIAGSRDLAGALRFARDKGGPALRELGFKQRGELLRRLAKALHEKRDELIGLAVKNGGNTRSDAKFDIDGASFTLSYYADFADTLGDARTLLDGEPLQLGRSARFYGQHVLSPRAGVAVHVNAYNFPAWGPAEKAACAILAGMPVLTKPATATALVTHRMVELWTEAKILPEGALQLLLGPVGDLLHHVDGQDVLAFTGSGETGARLRGDPRIVSRGVRVNVEADSLNAAVLGEDVEPGSPSWDLFVADVARDMTQKTGQKCTAIRRVLVPPAAEARVREALVERLSSVKVGNPREDDVGMGPLSTKEQLASVREGVARLKKDAETVVEGTAPAGKGFFHGVVLLRQAKAEAASAVHEHEVFGPVATLLPYDGKAASAVDLVRRGAGGLVCSVYSDDRAFLRDFVRGAAPYHGRLYLGSAKIAGQTPGPGTVLPQLVHGGPGRAGAGEELGGLRGMMLYLQRTALEGDKALLEAITAPNP
jgi:3,4-dehydroadipyl-CoA semialdehyde dehydrogenase